MLLYAMSTRLYKYRDLSNFRYLVDIFLNNRLYASSYKNMNDPMEGMYRYHWDWDKEDTFDFLINEISKEKQKIGICCLSEVSNNELM